MWRVAGTFGFVVILLATALTAAGSTAAERVVHVYNWSDYIAAHTLDRFRAATGIRAVYDVFDSNEVLETKLIAGKSGYDVVFPSLKPYGERMIRAAMLKPFDRARLPNLKNVDPAMLKVMAEADPGNRHLVPYMWGTTGIGYNTAKVKAALGPAAPVTSWRLLFDPQAAKKLGACGISILDDDEALAAMLVHLGRDPNAAKPQDLGAAVAAYAKIRPYVRYFHSSKYIEALANGDLCVALGFSGDVVQARNRAREAKNGVDIAYAIPSEGASLWVDTMAIPKDAPHLVEAHAFIDFLMRPEIIAEISNKVAYANANAAATPLVAAEVRDDPGVYPSDAVKARLFTLKLLAESERRLRTRAWTKITTGQ
ncbi:MAG: polyamine ABC transporter substrate-binding protein [Rhodospirillales bacterium]